MTGENVLTLNHETMVKALQLWVDATFKDPPTVVSVSTSSSTSGYNTAKTFEVKLEEKKTVP